MIPAQVRVFVCTEPVDMRLGFDRLMQLVRQRAGREPQDGGLFAFANRKKNRLKLLWFEKNGTVVMYKRLHRAKFLIPVGDGASVQIDGAQLAQLLAGQARNDRKSARMQRCPKASPAVRQSA